MMETGKSRINSYFRGASASCGKDLGERIVNCNDNLINETILLTICFLSVGAGMKMIAQDKKQTPVYLDDTQPMEARVQDALNRMTVEEKLVLAMHRESSVLQVVPVWVFLNFG